MIALWMATALADPLPLEDTVFVMVAARDLPAGAVITEEDLYAVPLPPRLLPAGVILTPDDVVEHRVETPMFANELVHRTWISPAEVPTPLSRAPEGWHLVPLRIAAGKLGAHHDLVLADRDCAVARDVVMVSRDPAAVAVAPGALEAVLRALTEELELVPVDPARAACAG